MKNKTLKYSINFAIFVMVVAFVVYMIRSVYQEDVTLTDQKQANIFVSPYQKTCEIVVGDSILAFDIAGDQMAVATQKQLKVFNAKGQLLHAFGIRAGIRDLMLFNDRVFGLYATSVAVYSLQGDSLSGWEACSDLSDYCSFTQAGGFVFVTDAVNKNICKYTQEGNFVQFIESPHGFIIPSYAFDIAAYHDTIYCANAGRHLVESYTVQGNFIAAFGGPGSEEAFFSGCSNPAFIGLDEQGAIFTSEKGMPRISRYSRKGRFEEMILNHRLLGAGNEAHDIKVAGNRLWVAQPTQIDCYEVKK